MALNVELKLDGAAELLISLQRLRRVIRTGVSGSVGRRIGREGVRIIKKLTPRQSARRFRTGSTSRGFQPFFRQWQLLERQADSNTYHAVIRNQAVSTRAGLIALASVEFGAKPHTIRPRGNYPLRWRQSSARNRFLGRTFLSEGTDIEELRIRQPRQRGEILARSVNHPGNDAFHMVQDTRIQLQRVADATLVQFQREIEAVFGPLAISVT